MITSRPPLPPVHLPVLSTRRDAAHRWTVIALAAAAVALMAAAYFQPWWQFTLYAPQYPSGLRLHVSLTGVGGDVREINMLNHYIGMGHLEDAAPVERALAAWGVAGFGALTLALALVVGKRGNWALLVPAGALLVGFVADSWFWLHRFGHHLDPRAPLHIPPFTPALFGAGKIGQFRTVAVPELGFLLVVAALGMLMVAVMIRRRVCSQCGRRRSCGATCPALLVGPR
jgi:hypothetical protein